jgi:hypothetical protein
MRQRMSRRRNKFQNRRNGRGKRAGKGGRGGGKRGRRQGGKGGKNNKKNSTPYENKMTTYKETPTRGGGATNAASASGAQARVVVTSPSSG